jgi:hypothetical protein
LKTFPIFFLFTHILWLVNQSFAGSNLSTFAKIVVIWGWVYKIFLSLMLFHFHGVLVRSFAFPLIFFFIYKCISILIILIILEDSSNWENAMANVKKSFMLLLLCFLFGFPSIFVFLQVAINWILRSLKTLKIDPSKICWS